MSDVDAFLDEFWTAHQLRDDHTPLWDADLSQITRWVSSSAEATTARRAAYDELRVRALELVAEAADPATAASLQTAADAASLGSALTDVWVERELPHPELGLHSYLYWAVNNYPLVTSQDGAAYIQKLAGLPAAMGELADRLELAAGEGRAQLQRHSRRAIEKLDAHLAASIAEDPLLEQSPPTDLNEVETALWRDDVAVEIERSVRPALALLRDAIRDHVLPAGPDDEHPGLCHQEGGGALYTALVAGYTHDRATPDEVHETGLEQVARLETEYRELGGRVLGTDDVAEIYRRLREDESLYHQTADSVVKAATAMHAQAQARAPDWFLRTPVSPCEVRPTEHGSMAFYSRPTADGSRPGVFFFNVADATVWGPNLASTVFHEGIPGHHFQLALAVEDDTLPELHRELFLPAFGEGWALYAERLADEMGLFSTDIERLGMLASDSLRACRLVVDTGLHAKSWTRQQAIDYVIKHSPLDTTEITAEIDRYIGMPGQATSYMIGRLEIERLRDESSDRLGDAFDLREFHDVVLSRGMLSLSALRTIVEAWEPAGA